MLAGGEIYGYFDRQFSEGILDSWDCSPEDGNNFPCINVSNRYLTPRKEAPGLEAIPFHKGVDPQGILQDMAKGDGLITYIHTEDNVVQFFNTKKDTDGNSKSVTWIVKKAMTYLRHLDSSVVSHRCSASATLSKSNFLWL